MLTENRVNPSMLSRRDLLTQAGCGFGSLALSAMMSEQGLLASSAKVSSPDCINFSIFSNSCFASINTNEETLGFIRI